MEILLQWDMWGSQPIQASGQKKRRLVLGVGVCEPNRFARQDGIGRFQNSPRWRTVEMGGFQLGEDQSSGITASRFVSVTPSWTRSASSSIAARLAKAPTGVPSYFSANIRSSDPG